ncbi:winged helix-turn-helix domain-containing protein [Streptomyces erythrochromogenes]|uniref:winged helix-turn-helix domain-containing protein n=1 Tax=Streptomyces erythrochromogenes TaxID=285574 RepID=UPI0037D05603
MPSLRDTIADDLRTQIATGHLEAGARLPSEPQLATYYKVSTPTLRNALALLQAEGLIEKIHGRATSSAARSSDSPTSTAASSPARTSASRSVRHSSTREVT